MSEEEKRVRVKRVSGQWLVTSGPRRVRVVDGDAHDRGDGRTRPVEIEEQASHGRVGGKSVTGQIEEQVNRSKEAPIMASIRWLAREDVPQPTLEQRAEQERDAAEREVARRRAEQQAREADIEREELARLRAGARTQRQERAEEYIRYLHLVEAGRWVPSAEEAASQGTIMDDARALTAATQAARAAVTEALKPLIEAAEREAAQADEERASILRAGHL